jgi:hypothetical protein
LHAGRSISKVLGDEFRIATIGRVACM